MISSLASSARITRSTEIAPDWSPSPPSGYESPQESRNGGWLGQTPPPSRAPTAPAPRPTTSSVPAATGYESPSDAREAGWLGQTPPPSAPATDARSATTVITSTPPVTGHESPQEAHDAGWLGQTPPPAPAAPAQVEPQRTSYANPQLAPEPWKDSGSLFGDDPTLFG